MQSTCFNADTQRICVTFTPNNATGLVTTNPQPVYPTSGGAFDFGTSTDLSRPISAADAQYLRDLALLERITETNRQITEYFGSNFGGTGTLPPYQPGAFEV